MNQNCMNETRVSTRKCVAFVLLCLLMLCLVACTEGDAQKKYGYKLQDRNGEKYIIFENAAELGTTPADNFIIPYIQFATFEEMLDAVQTGDFTEKELSGLYCYYLDYLKDGGLPVCDLDTFSQLKFPSGLPEPVILWSGPDYYLKIESDNVNISAYCDSCYISWDYYKEKIIFELLDDSRIFEIQEEQDRNATVCYLDTWQGDMKSVFYTIEASERTLYIREDYYGFSSPRSYYDNSIESGVPSVIMMYAEDSEHERSLFVIEKLAERPSVEWLKSFSFFEYKIE